MGRLSDVLTSLAMHPLRWAVWAGAVFATLLLVALLAIGWVGSERAIHPSPPDDLPLVQDFAHLPLERVAFLSRDGTRLRGWFVPSAAGSTREAPTIVLLHGYGEQKEEMLPHAAYLHAAGYNLLLFDFRASGESGGDAVTVGAFEQHDALGALDYLEARGDVAMQTLGLQGLSMGAAVAIMVAAQDGRVIAVVAEAPFKDIPSEVDASFSRRIGLPSFPFAPVTVWITERRLDIDASAISTLRALPGLEGRLLLVIEDELDESIAPGSARTVFEAASEPKRYWLAPGAEHAGGHGADSENYERVVLAFWSEVFGR